MSHPGLRLAMSTEKKELKAPFLCQVRFTNFFVVVPKFTTLLFV